MRRASLSRETARIILVDRQRWTKSDTGGSVSEEVDLIVVQDHHLADRTPTEGEMSWLRR